MGSIFECAGIAIPATKEIIKLVEVRKIGRALPGWKGECAFNPMSIAHTFAADSGGNLQPIVRLQKNVGLLPDRKFSEILGER